MRPRPTPADPESCTRRYSGESMVKVIWLGHKLHRGLLTLIPNSGALYDHFCKSACEALSPNMINVDRLQPRVKPQLLSAFLNRRVYFKELSTSKRPSQSHFKLYIYIQCTTLPLFGRSSCHGPRTTTRRASAERFRTETCE